MQRSLIQSAKKLLEDKIQALGVGHMFEVLNDRIITPGGGVIVFQGMQDASAELIKSFENFRIAWVVGGISNAGRRDVTVGEKNSRAGRAAETETQNC